MTKGELAEGDVAFAAETTLTEPDKIFRCVVLRTISDAEVFAAAHLQSGLNETFLSPSDELAGLDHHAFAAAAGKSLPPRDCITDSALITERDCAPLRWGYDLIGGTAKVDFPDPVEPMSTMSEKSGTSPYVR